MISDTLKKCMQLQLLRPWTTIPKNARYFIADANHRDKFDLDDEQQVFFGDKIMIKEVEDKNYYYPTLLFWKTYCVSNFMKTDSEIKCNYEHLISRMTSKGGSSQQFILGVFDKDFYESAESTKKALMLNEEIYKKQIEQYNNNMCEFILKQNS
jgi:Mg2+ and Co2+ transporter CorA